MRRVPDPERQDILTCQDDDCRAIVIRDGDEVSPHTWAKRERMSGTVRVLLCADCAIKTVQNEHGVDRDTARNHVMGAISG